MERVNKVIEIDRKVANDLIQLYKPDYKVEEIERFTGGKSTSNYKVKIAGSDLVLVLKIYPQRNSICEKESAIYKKVGGYVPVPEIFYINTDRTIIDKSYSIVEYLDGTTLDEYIIKNNRFPKKLAGDIGEKLALLHQSEYEKEGLLDKNLNLTDELPPILTWYDHFLNGTAGQRLTSSVRNKLHDFIKDNEDLLFLMTRRSVFSHGDFRPANLMVKDDRLIGFLDWEFSLSAPCYFDIGQFIRAEGYMLGDTESYFIEGYNRKAKYPVSDQWKRLAKLMDLANMLSFLNAKEERPNLYSNMKKIIDKSLAFLMKD